MYDSDAVKRYPISSNLRSQLDALNNQLEVENRIREGAENLLHMSLAVSSWFTQADELRYAPCNRHFSLGLFAGSSRVRVICGKSKD